MISRPRSTSLSALSWLSSIAPEDIIRILISCSSGGHSSLWMDVWVVDGWWPMLSLWGDPICAEHGSTYYDTTLYLYLFLLILSIGSLGRKAHWTFSFVESHVHSCIMGKWMESHAFPTMSCEFIFFLKKLRKMLFLNLYFMEDMKISMEW